MPLHPADRRDLAASVLAPQLRIAMLEAEGRIAEEPLAFAECSRAERDVWLTRALAVIELFADPLWRGPLAANTPYFDLAVRLARQQGVK